MAHALRDMTNQIGQPLASPGAYAYPFPVKTPGKPKSGKSGSRRQSLGVAGSSNLQPGSSSEMRMMRMEAKLATEVAKNKKLAKQLVELQQETTKRGDYAPVLSLPQSPPQLAGYKALETERDSALVDKCNAEKALAEALLSCAEKSSALQEEMEDLKAALAAEKEAHQETRDQLIILSAARDAAVKEVEDAKVASLKMAEDAAAEATTVATADAHLLLETLRGERDEAMKECTELARERDELVEERDTLVFARDAAEEQLAELMAAEDTVEATMEAAHAENALALKAAEAAHAEALSAIEEAKTEIAHEKETTSALMDEISMLSAALQQQNRTVASLRRGQMLSTSTALESRPTEDTLHSREVECWSEDGPSGTDTLNEELDSKEAGQVSDVVVSLTGDEKAEEPQHVVANHSGDLEMLDDFLDMCGGTLAFDPDSVIFESSKPSSPRNSYVEEIGIDSSEEPRETKTDDANAGPCSENKDNIGEAARALADAAEASESNGDRTKRRRSIRIQRRKSMEPTEIAQDSNVHESSGRSIMPPKPPKECPKPSSPLVADAPVIAKDEKSNHVVSAGRSNSADLSDGSLYHEDDAGAVDQGASQLNQHDPGAGESDRGQEEDQQQRKKKKKKKSRRRRSGIFGDALLLPTTETAVPETVQDRPVVNNQTESVEEYPLRGSNCTTQVEFELDGYSELEDYTGGLMHWDGIGDVETREPLLSEANPADMTPTLIDEGGNVPRKSGKDPNTLHGSGIYCDENGVDCGRENDDRESLRENMITLKVSRVQLERCLGLLKPAEKNHNAASVALAVAACGMPEDLYSDPTAAIWGLFMAVIKAEADVQSSMESEEMSKDVYPQCSSQKQQEGRRVHFASHDFSAVSPPVDTINESEAPMETAAGLLSNILVEKKRVQHSSPTALQSAGKALQVLAEAALLAQKQPDASNEIEAAALVCLESKCGAQLLCKIAQLTKVALRTVASSARILSEEFLVTDQEIDGEAFSLSSSSSSIPTGPGPIRSTLSQFLVSVIRYHLRRLLNAPPPPATSPNTVQTSNPYTENGCRSGAYTLFCFCFEDAEESSCSTDTAYVFVKSLEAMHALRCLDESVQRGESPAVSGVLERLSNMPNSIVPEDITIALTLLESAGARRFMQSLLDWPGLMDMINSYGEGWKPIERLAMTIAATGIGAHQHFTMLQNLEILRDLVQQALPLEPSAKELQDIGHRLTQLTRNSMSATNGTARSGKGRRAITRHLGSAALDALGNGPLSFPTIEEVEDEAESEMS